ncbi:hypothetical protein M3J09_004123 [Ascochyta lentis]
MFPGPQVLQEAIRTCVCERSARRGRHSRLGVLFPLSPDQPHAADGVAWRVRNAVKPCLGARLQGRLCVSWWLKGRRRVGEAARWRVKDMMREEAQTGNDAVVGCTRSLVWDRQFTGE